jgi:hypothetical protein
MIIEVRKDAFSPLDADLGEGPRPDIEKEEMPVLQSQKAADEITDHPSMGEGNNGFGGIGGDPPGNGIDPFTEVAEALAAREGKIPIEGCPALIPSQRPKSISLRSESTSQTSAAPRAISAV